MMSVGNFEPGAGVSHLDDNLGCILDTQGMKWHVQLQHVLIRILSQEAVQQVMINGDPEVLGADVVAPILCRLFGFELCEIVNSVTGNIRDA